MADLLNIPNALAGGFTNWGQTAGQNIQRNRLLAREQEQQNALAQALAGGNESAITQALAPLSPTAAISYQQGNAKTRQDQLEQQRARYMDASAGTLASIWQLPPEQRPAAFEQAQMGLHTQFPDFVDSTPDPWDENGARQHAMTLAAQDKRYADVFGRVGLLPPEPPKPEGRTELQRNLSDPATAAFLREQEANKLKMRATGGGDAYHPLAMTNQGALQFINGQWQPVQIGGSTALPVSADVNLAGARANAVTQGKAAGDAAVNLPSTLATADQAIAAIDGLLAAPGRATMTGLSGKFDPRNYIAGTDAADAKVRLDQIKGQTFLQAYQSLRGGGQITEAEGAKAEAALARLNAAQSDAEFVKALREVRHYIELGKGRAIAKARSTPNAMPQAPAESPNVVDWNDLP